MLKAGRNDGIAVALLILMLGIALSTSAVLTLQDAFASSSWSEIEGTIFESRVNESISSGSSRTYSAYIRYRYSVNGANHIANRVSFSVIEESDSAAESAVAKYPIGETVTVYYDPESPDSAVLELGVSWSGFLMLAIGVPILLAGLYALRLGLADRKDFEARTSTR